MQTNHADQKQAREKTTRRPMAFLYAVAAVAFALAISGCLGSSDDDHDEPAPGAAMQTAGPEPGTTGAAVDPEGHNEKTQGANYTKGGAGNGGTDAGDEDTQGPPPGEKPPQHEPAPDCDGDAKEPQCGKDDPNSDLQRTLEEAFRWVNETTEMLNEKLDAMASDAEDAANETQDEVARALERAKAGAESLIAKLQSTLDDVDAMFGEAEDEVARAVDRATAGAESLLAKIQAALADIEGTVEEAGDGAVETQTEDADLPPQPVSSLIPY